MQALKQAPVTDFELYHVERDPAEKTELSAKEPARLAELKAVLERFHASVRAEGPVWPAFVDPGYEQQRIEWPAYQAKPRPAGL